MATRGNSLAPISRARLTALCRKYHVRRLSIFGSAARGELAPGSDIDLLIEFAPGKSPPYRSDPEMRSAFSELFGGRCVDLVAPEVLENPYRRKSILRDLKLLYVTPRSTKRLRTNLG